MQKFLFAVHARFTELKSRSEDGATAVEYGIMVALIAVVIIAAVYLIGTELDSAFDCVGGKLNNHTSTTGCL